MLQLTSNRLLNQLMLGLTILSLAASCAQNNRGGVGAEDMIGSDGEPVGNDVINEGDDTSDIDEGLPDPSTNPNDESAPPPCAEITAQAENLYLPVDIIWAIDSSPSMGTEIELIQERMNGFAEFVENSGLDYQIVLIAAEYEDYDTTFDVCLPPPLSSVNSCPDEDGPRYRHVKRHVDSLSALDEIVVSYPEYQDVLRDGASVHMVVVSDDESDVARADFIRELGLLGHSPFEDSLTFHSIVSGYNEDCLLGFCWETGCEGPYGSADNYGEEYISLTEETGGVFSDICTAEWDPIFDSIADTVLATTRLPCSFVMPETPDGLVVDFDLVEISFTSEDGSYVELTNVGTELSCGNGSGWYYDNPNTPTTINLCPDACGDMFGNLEISFGCTKG